MESGKLSSLVRECLLYADAFILGRREGFICRIELILGITNFCRLILQRMGLCCVRMLVVVAEKILGSCDRISNPEFDVN